MHNDLLPHLWNSQHNVALQHCDIMSDITNHAHVAGHVTYHYKRVCPCYRLVLSPKTLEWLGP